MTLLSFIYIALIYHYSKIRERFWLIAVESVNLICLCIYFVEYSFTHYFVEYSAAHTYSFVSANSPIIIQTCFFLELLIVLGGLAIGVRKRSKVLGARDSNRDSSSRRNFLFS